MENERKIVDGMTPGEIARVHAYNAWIAAENAFIAAYTADPNRKGMRPGDFRYRKDLRSPATQTAAEAFHLAGEAYCAVQF
jgi:hypothetical protein